MPELASAVCSITRTQRRRFFWAAWWTAAPRESPFRKPDASHGGLETLEAALAEAEQRAERYLVLIEPSWARAWTRVLRGERPPPRPDPAAQRAGRGSASGSIERPERQPSPPSAWQLLGLEVGASLAEVKTAFRRCALVAHPDQGGDPDRFRELHRAYERLVTRVRSRRE